jgi:hypothetical protein
MQSLIQAQVLSAAAGVAATAFLLYCLCKILGRAEPDPNPELGPTPADIAAQAAASIETIADLDIDAPLEREARRRAIRDWHRLAPEQQARADFGRMVNRHRAALERCRAHES